MTLQNRLQSEDGDLYRRIIENTSDLVFLLAADSTCAYANASARSALGIALDQDVFAAVHRDDIATARQQLERVVAGDELSLSYRVRDPRGGWRWLEIWASPISYRGEPHAVAIARDVTDRKGADQRQALQLAVSRVLAEARDTHSVGLPLLEAICASVGFDLGELWQFEDTSLRCIAQWQSQGLGAGELATVTASTRFHTDAGLPGKVWARNEAVWITDVTQNPMFLRAAAAAKAGLHTAIGCPVVHDDQLLAVLVILSREIVEPNREMLELLSAVGSQIAQFMARQHAEAALREADARLGAVVDFAPVVLFAIDRAGTITFAKGRGLGLAGLPMSGSIGESYETVHAHQPTVLSAVGRALGGEEFIGHIEINGRTFETVWTPAFARDGSANGTIGVSLDVTDRARAERATLDEKERLIKEIHHRVKNNLQLVISLLGLQSDQLEPAYPGITRAFIETQLRIQTMAQIHESLCRTGNVTHLELATHVESICAQIYRSFAIDPDRVALELDIADVSMGLDIALPCGLIINELVANALKHAFPNGRSGTVAVRLTASHDRVDLRVSDDGIGIPPSVDPMNCDSLGLQLIRDLAEQLHATLEIQRHPGTTVELGVPWSQVLR